MGIGGGRGRVPYLLSISRWAAVKGGGREEALDVDRRRSLGRRRMCTQVDH